jgi:hypothetical protein
MKNLVFLLLLIFSLYSCERQNKKKEFPLEKVYIVECNWTFSEDDYKMMFRVVGFSELDANFNLKFAYKSTDDHYFTSNIFIVDSLINKISGIVENYPADTTFLYKGRLGERIYDGNSYLFIFQKNDSNLIRIYFEPQFLPQDLSFLYSCLYEDRQKQVWKSQYTELIKEFENIIMSGKDIVPPPPILKKTIQFTPPVIKE